MEGENKVSAMLRRRWLIFIILALAYFSVYFHRVTTGVLSEHFREDFMVDATSLALLSSLYFYAYGVMQLPVGVLTDRLGPRRTLLIIIGLAPIGIFLTSIAKDFSTVLIGRVLIGLGMSAVSVPAMRIFSAWYQKDSFATVNGSLLAIGNFGGMLAAGPFALITNTHGWREVYLILGIVTALIAILALVLLRNKPEDLDLPSSQEVYLARTKETVDEDPYDPDHVIESIPTGRALRMVFRNRCFWRLAFWFFLLYGSLMTYQGLWATPFFNEALGWDLETSSTVISFIGIGIIIGAPVAGFLSDKILRSRKKVLVIGTAVYALAWAVLWAISGSTAGPAHYMALHFVFGFFGGFYTVGFAQVKEIFPVAIVGTSTAALNIFPFAGSALMQQVSALLVSDGSLASYQSVWLFLLISVLVSLLLVMCSTDEKAPRASL